MKTPYDNKIQNLRQKLKKPGGQQRQRARLQSLQAKKRDFKGGNGGKAGNPYDGTYTLPFDAGYDLAVASADRDLAFANQAIGVQRSGLGSQSALLGKEKGLAGEQHGLNTDYLKHQEGAQQKRTLNSYARTGQLYAGSLQDARTADAYYAQHAFKEEDLSYRRDLLGLERSQASLSAASAGLGLDSQMAQIDYQDALAAAEADRLAAALENYPDPSLAPKPGGGGRPNKPGGAKRPPKPGPNFTWNANKGHWVRTAPPKKK